MKGASATIKDKKGVSAADLAKQSKALLELFSPKSQKPINLAMKKVKDAKKSKADLFDGSAVRPYTADADAYLVA